MVRLKGLGSFVVIATIVLVALRALHVGVPLFVPGARPGPFTLASLDDVPRYAGFAPIVPAYHPASLGDRPASITVWLSPRPTVAIVWSGEHTLLLTEHQGGEMPNHAAISQPFTDVPDSLWWQDGARCHLVLKRGELWIEMETDLDERDLRRFADTLSRY
jgi:hypothetical protein